MPKLSARQQRFVDEYLFDLIGTQAAIRAGYSPTTAQEQASRLLSNVMVSAAISKAMAERSRRTGITNDRILLELAKIGFANAADIINLNAGTVQEGGGRDDTAAIQSVKVKTIPTEEGDIVEQEVRLYDKTKALELMGRHTGLFNDKLSIMNLPPPVFSGENDLE